MIDLTAWAIGASLASGALVGLFLAVFGGGGSVLAAPLLLYAVGIRDPHLAIGTSSIAVAANAAFNLLGHWRGRRVKWPCALVFAGAGVIGSIGGSSVAKLISGQSLLLGFAAAMAAIAVSMFRRPASEGDPGVTITPALILRLAPLGLLTGFAAGFFGIGGGFLVVPGLMLATGMTITHATASSLVSVALFGATTSASYALSGWVDWRIAGLLLAGGILGSLVGLRLAGGVLAKRGDVTRRAFATIVLLVAGYVTWRALTTP